MKQNNKLKIFLFYSSVNIEAAKGLLISMKACSFD